MTDLAEFLLARIAEDEALASDARGQLLMVQAPLIPYLDQFTASRMLVECEAKRRLIEIDGRQAKDKGILAALALPYADHPDFDPAWRS